MKKTILALATVFALAACGPAIKDSVQTCRPDARRSCKRFKTPDTLAARGSYTALKEACRLYAGAYTRPALRARMAAAYFRAAFLLVLREKELGLSNRRVRPVSSSAWSAKIRAWPVTGPVSRAGRPDFNPRIKGVVKDYTLGIVGAVPGEEAERLYADIKSRIGQRRAGRLCLPGLWNVPGSRPTTSSRT